MTMLTNASGSRMLHFEVLCYLPPRRYRDFLPQKYPRNQTSPYLISSICPSNWHICCSYVARDSQVVLEQDMSQVRKQRYLSPDGYQAIGAIADYSEVLEHFRRKKYSLWKRVVCWFARLVLGRR